MPAIQITLTTASTAYNVLTLMRAIDSTVEGHYRTVLFESDAANVTASTISVGDSEISTGRYGYQLGPGDSREYQSSGGHMDPKIQLGQMWVMGSSNSLLLNIEVL